MGRSSKKGPYIDQNVLKKIMAQKGTGVREPIKTWARASDISPEMVGHTIAIHNGRVHIPVFITENMVGHKLGEFALTRTFRAHSRKGYVKPGAEGVKAPEGVKGAKA